MLFPAYQPIKRSRILQRAHPGLLNVLKARFTPTAIWTSGDDSTPTARPATETNDGATPVITRSTSNPAPLITRTTSSPSPTPTPATTVAAPTASASTVSTSGGTTTNVAAVSTTSSGASSASTSSTPSSLLTTSSAKSSATPTITTSSSALTTSPGTTARVTRTVSSHTSLGSASSATSTTTSTSGITTAGIVGIAAAGIVGAVVVASIVMFLIRRRNRRQDEFDPDDFRRQSVILRDEDSPALQRGNSSGRGAFGPRPPTMFERHHQNVVTFATPPSNMYQSSDAPYGSANPFGNYTSQQHPSFSPGMYAGLSAQYANASAFNNPMVQSSTGTPASVASYGGTAYDAQGRLARAPSNASAPVLLRNNSVAHPPYPPEEADYADLTRSSVTPFQAAQYEAISKQLNIPPPKPLYQVPEAVEAEEPDHAKEADSTPMVSPFEDPRASTTQGAPANENGAIINHARASSEVQGAMEPDSRVPSMPPSLPEIKMMSGSFSPVTYSFPVTPSPRNGSFEMQGGRASPKVDLPPLSPVNSSPRRAQFVDGLEARAHDGHETPVEISFVGKEASVTKADAQPSAGVKIEAPKAEAANSEAPSTEAAKTDAPKSAAPKRPETVYSDEDAYGGF